MAQNQDSSAGFALPAPSEAASGSVVPVATVVLPAGEKFEGTYHVVPAEISPRDKLIGGGVLVVLLIAFFFAKNAYSNGLVAKRVPPNKANAAGWWLWIFLACLSAGIVLAIIDTAAFLNPVVVGALVVIGAVALVLTFVTGRK